MVRPAKSIAVAGLLAFGVFLFNQQAFAVLLAFDNVAIGVADDMAVMEGGLPIYWIIWQSNANNTIIISKQDNIFPEPHHLDLLKNASHTSHPPFYHLCILRQYILMDD